MFDIGFCSVIRSLRLRNIDDGIGYGFDYDYVVWCFVFYEVVCDGGSEEVGIVYVDGLEFVYVVDGVVDSFEVFCKVG